MSRLVGWAQPITPGDAWGRWLVLCLLVYITVAIRAAPLRVASFNIHYVTPNQTDIVWSERREAVRRVIGEMDADITAFQEYEGIYPADHYPILAELKLSWTGKPLAQQCDSRALSG